LGTTYYLLFWTKKIFFFIYLVGGIFSSLFHVGYQNLFDYPKDIPSHGASGSIMAISTLFASLWPNTQVYLYFLIPIPAKYLVIGLIGWDMYNSIKHKRESISHAGHIGGALFGFLYYLYFKRRIL
jgi:membrane associated rhomboid family serine protease